MEPPAGNSPGGPRRRLFFCFAFLFFLWESKRGGSSGGGGLHTCLWPQESSRRRRAATIFVVDDDDGGSRGLARDRRTRDVGRFVRGHFFLLCRVWRQLRQQKHPCFCSFFFFGSGAVAADAGRESSLFLPRAFLLLAAAASDSAEASRSSDASAARHPNEKHLPAFVLAVGLPGEGREEEGGGGRKRRRRRRHRKPLCCLRRHRHRRRLPFFPRSALHDPAWFGQCFELLRDDGARRRERGLEESCRGRGEREEDRDGTQGRREPPVAARAAAEG